jgi:alpha-D-ribose 1-methylphosphonate 5-triphosphate synthase subunit PhnH
VIDLGTVDAGFADPAEASQRVFRQALDALSHPGRIYETSPDLPHAARALLLALADADTPVWFSPSAADSIPTLRFHTGCGIAESPARAAYAWIAAAGELPLLRAFAAGSDEHPEHSTTLIVEVPLLAANGPWSLAGPGIREHASLRVEGLPERFAAEWHENHRWFPRGVDLYFTCGRKLAGLPRTTRLACT